MKKPIFYTFDLNEKTRPPLLAIVHTDDENNDVLQIHVTQNGAAVDMTGKTVTARAVMCRSRALVSDNIACTVTASGDILIPFDNAAITSRAGDMLLEVNAADANGELTLQFPLKVRVNGSILDTAQVLPDSQGRIPDLLQAAQRELERVEDSLSGKADKATTLSGYGITDAYTKTEIDNKGYLTAHQDVSGKENIVNKTTVLTANSTDAQYPSAKAAVKSLSEVSGVLDTGALTVPKGSSQKPLMTVDLKKDEQIFILFELAAPLNVNTYAFLTNANGVSILSGNSVVIGAGITSLLIPFRPTVDYNGAVVKYTVSSSASANAQLRSVKLLRPGMIPHQLFADGYRAVIAPSGVNSAAAFPHVYSADSMTVTTDGTSYCGARLLLFDFAVGSTLCVKADRDTGNQWALRIAFYDKDGQRVGTDVTGNNMIERTVSDGTAYIEIMFGACWGTALTAGTVVTFTGIEVYFSELVKLRQTVFGEGANTYNGARLDLSDPLAAVQRCDMSLWLDFRNVGDYRLNKNQSIAIYGDDLFLLQEGGGCVVVDRQNKTVVTTVDFAPTEYQHANSAQFTDIFYDSGDDYPLLMISRCGNVSVSPTTNLDECQFYRIHNGAMTLINRVYSDAGTYSASWGYDPSAKRIYMGGYTNGNYQVTTNNPLRFWVWKMPSASEICGGTDITLHTADCVGESQTEHLTLQGMTVRDGIVYSGITRNGHHVYAFDVYGGSVISKIQLENNGFEVEGVAVADGRLYVSRKNGADTTGINPCKIYEIIFPAGGSAGGLRGEKGDKGNKGDKGDTGAAGAKGDPGDDYVLTAQDKENIANIVLQLLPTTQGVLYGNASN